MTISTDTPVNRPDITIFHNNRCSNSRGALALLREHGGRRLPSRIARGWERGRFSGPYLRDDLMDHGVLADTLETATTWSNVARLHAAVGSAISGALGSDGAHSIVQCHVSHVYESGCSLYYTFIAAEETDPLAQWERVKAAATAAIVDHGGTVTHHHAVGTDHRAALGQAE